MIKENYYPFSVLISVYKNERASNLDMALNSIENQTVQPDEIILIEDGPLTPSLETVIKKHQQKSKDKLKCYKFDHNMGLGYALNFGVNKCSNNIIARMDSDDISVPNRFELQLKKFESEPNLALLGGQVYEFENKIDNVVSKRWVPLNEMEIRAFLKYRNPFNHPTVMFKKNAVLNVNNYSNFKGFEDYDLWSKFIEHKYKVANLSELLVLMRTDEGLYSRRGGIRYLYRYFKLRKLLQRRKIINTREKVNGDLLMSVNVLIPAFIRKEIYKRFLRK